MLGTMLVSSQPAMAVSDEEFEALKQQMAVFAGQLETMQQKQEALEQENASLKQQNTDLVVQNKQLVQKVESSMQKTETLAAQLDSVQEENRHALNTQAEILASVAPAAGEKDGMLIPGTDTRVKLGGYVKADAIHDFNVSRDGSGEDFGLFAAIPLSNTTSDLKDSNTRLHARQTRINLTATTPTDHGDLKVFVEGDFYAGAGSQTTTNAANFGLRHAYGELAGVLVGQTWTNYMDLAAYPESLDFVGVTGNTLVRQGQVRYTHKPEGSDNAYSISIENPDSEFLSDPANPGVDSGIEEYPDITAKARFKVGEKSEVSVKAVGRKLEAFDTATNSSDSDFGYALGVSGKLQTTDKDDLRFQLGYGDGIGRYIFDLAAAGQGAGFTSSTRRSLETIEAWGGYASYRHWWNDSLRSNVMAGTVQVVDNPTFLSRATTNKEIYSAHGNLIWSVNDKVDVGAEYIYGHRETEDGSEGTLHRAQASAKYKF